MLQQPTLKFLKELKKNNNKPWFDQNRKLYDIARADFITFTEKLILSVAKFDPPIGQLSAKDCIFRINKDVRFSKDKSPYKTNMGASFTNGGKKINAAGYYFHLEPGQSFLAGGFYMPEPEQLAQIRQEIDYNYEEWLSIINNKTFKKYFPEGVEGISSLSRPPKGYEADNPAIHYLKMKGFIVSQAIKDAELTQSAILKNTEAAFKAMKPLIDFLNRATT
jgi:uncharacterized protein (TIGR02453 family)